MGIFNRKPKQSQPPRSRLALITLPDGSQRDVEMDDGLAVVDVMSRLIVRKDNWNERVWQYQNSVTMDALHLGIFAADQESPCWAYGVIGLTIPTLGVDTLAFAYLTETEFIIGWRPGGPSDYEHTFQSINGLIIGVRFWPPTGVDIILSEGLYTDGQGNRSIMTGVLVRLGAIQYTHPDEQYATTESLTVIGTLYAAGVRHGEDHSTDLRPMLKP
jgi:hypothetical protein